MKVRRDFLVLQREYRLDQPGDAGRRLQVSNVGLHRSQQARSARSAGLTQYRGEGLRFDGITQ